jgi:hypothetical protein
VFPPAVLVTERGLCELMLREWVDRGVAEVSVQPDVGAALACAADDAKRAQTDVVLLAADDGKHEPPRGVELHRIDVSKPLPWVAWPERTLDLLKRLV